MFQTIYPANPTLNGPVDANPANPSLTTGTTATPSPWRGHVHPGAAARR